MLVLSRRVNDAVLVGDSIRIEVLEIRGGRVRLGITAPPEVPVHRSEVAERCRENGSQQANSAEAGQAIVIHGEVVAQPQRGN